MTAEEARSIAESFLARVGGDPVGVVRVEAVPNSAGFLVFYEDARALRGDSRYQLLGNVPVVVSGLTGEATISGSVYDFRDSAATWLASRKL